MSGSNQQFELNSTSIFVFLWNKRKLLVIGALIAMVISGIITLFIPNKYTSEVIIFPVAEGTPSHDLFAYDSKRDLLRLGKENEVDQMLQILASDELKDHLIDKYNLYERYKVDSLTDKTHRWTMRKKVSKRFFVRATKYVSIIIEVSDTDPELAAEMTNEIASYTNMMVTRMFKKKAEDAFKLVEAEYLLLKNQIATAEDSLSTLRALGIQDYELQTERYSEALGLALVENNRRAEQILQQKLDILSEYGGAFLEMRDVLRVYYGRLGKLEEKYIEAKVDMIETLDRVFVVSKAQPTYKKTAPKRTSIAITTGIITFLLLVIILGINESLKTYFPIKKEE